MTFSLFFFCVFHFILFRKISDILSLTDVNVFVISLVWSEKNYSYKEMLNKGTWSLSKWSDLQPSRSLNLKEKQKQLEVKDINITHGDQPVRFQSFNVKVGPKVVRFQSFNVHLNLGRLSAFMDWHAITTSWKCSHLDVTPISSTALDFWSDDDLE